MHKRLTRSPLTPLRVTATYTCSAKQPDGNVSLSGVEGLRVSYTLHVRQLV
jgi:hypothetical protein